MTQPMYAPQTHSNFPLPSIRCAHCKKRHSSVDAVRNCASQQASRAGVVAQASTPVQNNRRIGMTPQETAIFNMLLQVPDGYYCVQPDHDDTAKFLRVSRPKKGQYAGSLKVQTKHSDDLRLALIIWQPGEPNMRAYWYNRSVQQLLPFLVVDPTGCAMRYSEKLNQCSRCTKDLTDGHSRWYGIGPDCQKIWTEFMQVVEGKKGPYVPEQM